MCYSATFFPPGRPKMNEYSHLTLSFRLKCIMHHILVFKNNHLVIAQWQSEVNCVETTERERKKLLFAPRSIIACECSWFFTWIYIYIYFNAPWDNIMKSKISCTENSLLREHSWQVLVLSHVVPLEQYILCM